MRMYLLIATALTLVACNKPTDYYSRDKTWKEPAVLKSYERMADRGGRTGPLIRMRTDAERKLLLDACGADELKPMIIITGRKLGSSLYDPAEANAATIDAARSKIIKLRTWTATATDSCARMLYGFWLTDYEAEINQEAGRLMADERIRERAKRIPDPPSV